MSDENSAYRGSALKVIRDSGFAELAPDPTAPLDLPPDPVEPENDTRTFVVLAVLILASTGAYLGIAAGSGWIMSKLGDLLSSTPVWPFR